MIKLKKILTSFINIFNINKPGPDFLIIGAQRSGTTSLFNYLSYHPQIFVPTIKELHYFYANPENNKSNDWYENQFPKISNTIFDYIFKKANIKGEATPYYLFHPLVPETVNKLYPKVKIIILLRDPVDRAISHYFHNSKTKFAQPEKSLEQSFEADLYITPIEERKIIDNPNYYSYHHQHHSYISRGYYKKQIAGWRKYFPDNQILILESEVFFANPYETLLKVCKFLKIRRYPASLKDKLVIFNKNEYEKISVEQKIKIKQKYFNNLII